LSLEPFQARNVAHFNKLPAPVSSALGIPSGMVSEKNKGKK
jgi:hypothetical protein